MPDAELNVRENRASLELNEKVYPRAVSLAAAYRFLDRCYVRLERSGRGRLEVRLKGKTKLARDELQKLADEFDNELLQQLMRQEVAERSRGIREAIVGRALSSAEPLANLDNQAPGAQAFDELDYSEDPLGIAVPWEEKYGEPDKD